MTSDNDNVTALPVADKKRRTITLTDRRPVELNESDWPVVAQGRYHNQPEHGGEDMDITFHVRMGKYNRYLVHAKYYYWHEDVECTTIRVGRLLGPHSHDEVEKTLIQVAEDMKLRVHSDYVHRWIREALDDCFANLGPQLL